MGEDGRWNIVVPFALVTDMDETMIYAHLELIRRLVAIALVLVKFLETLKGCLKFRNRILIPNREGVTHCSSTAAPPSQ